MVHEQRDAGSRRAQYSVTVAERSVAKLEGGNLGMDDLKAAIDDLDALAAMKDEHGQQG